MYPFYVLQLSHDATDQEVEERYLELLRAHPPDREPEVFAAIRKAYEALKDSASRRRTRLFYFDASGSGLETPLPTPDDDQPTSRTRLSHGELIELLCWGEDQ